MRPFQLPSSWRKGKVLCSVMCISLFLYYAYCYRERELRSSRTVPADDSMMPPLSLLNIIVHLDLKGAPPKLSYLTSILPTLKKHGANGLLIEYEDMFPFERDLAILRASNAYEKAELENFLLQAVRHGFKIIPLIQTFGHMQYVLKHHQYKTMREKPRTYGSICPSQNRSKQLLHNMLEQIIYFHAKITQLTFIHIGCDEVKELNVCDNCKGRHLPKLMIFQEHVKLMHNYVKELSPETEVLIWDDMLAGSDGIKLPVDLVHWHYNWKMNRALQEILTHKKNSHNLWAASAFKGADGMSSIVPDLEKRIENHFNWIKFFDNYARVQNLTKPDFRGIILTGWSRYDHFSPVCDLLPASYPSLITNLLLINRYNTQPYHSRDLLTLRSFYNSELVENVRQALGCYVSVENWCPSDVNCSFEGYDLFKILKQVEHVKMNRRRHLPERLRLEKEVAETMARYFDKHVVDNYLRYELTPPGMWPAGQKSANQPDVDLDSSKPIFKQKYGIFIMLFQLILHFV